MGFSPFKGENKNFFAFLSIIAIALFQTLRPFVLTLVFAIESIAAARARAKTAARHAAKAQVGKQFQRQVFLHRRQQQQQAEEVCEEAG